MDKPSTMPIKEYLLRVLSVRNNIPLKTLEAVVNHQFDELVEATRTKTSVELSGFGKFLFNKKKAYKYYQKHISKIEMAERKLNEPLASEAQLRKYGIIKEQSIKIVQDLKPRMDEYIRTNMGGVAQSDISPTPIEGENRGDIPSEDGSVQEL